MSFTYGNPAAKKKDAVRLTIGDTQQREQFLQDEEIEYFLGLNNGQVLAASLECCRAIIARLSRDVDEVAGNVSLYSHQAVEQYTALIKTLEAQLAVSGLAIPYAGGISLTDIDNQRADRDWNRPDFSMDMMRSPWVSRYIGLPMRSSLNRYIVGNDSC